MEKEYIYSLVEIKGYNKKEFLLSYVLLDLMMTSYMEKFSKMDEVLIILFFIFIPVLWFFRIYYCKNPFYYWLKKAIK